MKLKRVKESPSTLSYTFKVKQLLRHRKIPNQYPEKKLNSQELPIFLPWCNN